MKTRNGLFADVPENLWNDWHWLGDFVQNVQRLLAE